ncbi:MAG: penicillin-binding protein 2 [Candidatus Marinimicrobia bacterium]|nr:penicillin-binding protein 2 [Candidatus Neomarinimicrobiota bacterium]|tara:strand:+ start:472 stop:2229 length:1758 start_codon:yes stop_codon:yes gene_type:complete
MLKTEIYIPVRRRDIAFGVVLSLFIILIVRFYYLQIYKYEQYSAVAEANRIRMISSPAPRGNIVDRNGKIIAANTSIYAVSVIRDELIDEDVQLNMIAKYLNRGEETLKNNLDKYFQGRFLPALIARNVSISEISLIEEHNNELPGVISTKLPIRFYPNKKIRASHILGYLREINSIDIINTRGRNYSLGDYHGYQGIEKYYEEYLKGVKGVEYRQVDALGREVGEIVSKQPILAKPGNKLILTIDSSLQELIESLLNEHKGAAVIMNANSGEILAIASKPDFDLTDFTAGMGSKKWKSYSMDPDRPLFNRSVLGLYPPGSSMKLVTAIAVLQRGRAEKNLVADCNGNYEFGDRTFGCWKEDGHGRVNLSRAIIESCNIYFYQVVQKLDIDTLAKFAKLFGFGKFTGIDLPEENSGLFADRNYMNKKYGRWGWAKGSLLHLSIGQGDVLVTPLQMASFISTIATKGNVVIPRLRMGIEKVNSMNVQLNSSTWDKIHDMMYDVVNDVKGTAYDSHLARSKIKVYGKTGTAENPHGDPHAWFVGFAKDNNEIISISIVIENGGTGGSTAAPIASKIIKNYFDLKPLN